MSRPDGHDLIFDQTGQQVDLQYNAESIMVVNHIADGRGGKRCPRCNAAPMRQTSIVWEESTCRVDRGTKMLNSLASRVAPPRRPRPRDVSFPAGAYLKAFGVLGVLLLCGLGAGEAIVTVALLLGIVAVAAFLVWHLRSFRAERDADLRRTQQSTARYERERERWRRSWFCAACGARAVERMPQHRRSAESGSGVSGRRDNGQHRDGHADNGAPGAGQGQRSGRPRRRNRRPSRTD